MAGDDGVPIEERLARLLRHLGIERAHFAGDGGPVGRLAAVRPQAIASLTACFGIYAPAELGGVRDRLLVLHGDRGPVAAQAARALEQLPGAAEVILRDYFHAGWSDLVADRTEEVGRALTAFLADAGRREAAPPAAPPAGDGEGEGEVAGLTYRVLGAGPPLVLLPFGAASSQWEPLLPRLSREYYVVVLGGARLGWAGRAEQRAASPGFVELYRSLAADLALRPGAPVLDVGCGPGTLARRLARRRGGATPVVGVDASRYMLREAAALAQRDGLAVEFREGDAVALPFPDARFAAAVAVTVLEEGDAARMLAEMVRVTKAGGRVAAVVRAVDMAPWFNVSVRAATKAKAEVPAPGAGVAEGGCADASLYRRFRTAGLGDVKMGPRLISEGLIHDPLGLAIPAGLDPEEASEWRAAAAVAAREGTLFVAHPFHYAVGTKA